ncbi:MAG: hypothetical protein V2A79_13405 [Planctomycetota bacterium]
MRRRRLPLLVLTLCPWLLALAGVGCVTGDGWTRALADDLALTVSAATQGFLRGVLDGTAQ